MNSFTDRTLKRIVAKDSRRELKIVRNFQPGEREKIRTLVNIAKDIAVAGRPCRANEIFAQALHIARSIDREESRAAAFTEIAVQYGVATGAANLACSGVAGGAALGSFRADGCR